MRAEKNQLAFDLLYLPQLVNRMNGIHNGTQFIDNHCTYTIFLFRTKLYKSIHDITIHEFFVIQLQRLCGSNVLLFYTFVHFFAVFLTQIFSRYQRKKKNVHPTDILLLKKRTLTVVTVSFFFCVQM